METILSCYFDNIFVDLSRGSLLSRHKRRELTDYFCTIIEACVAAGDCTPQDGCRIAVVTAIKYHDKTKIENGAVCLLGKFHNVLYLAIKLCFDFRLNDTIVVRDLMNAIYQCEGTFERIFAGAIFGVRVSHFIAGWKSDFETQDENKEALEYFLQHATKAKLKFKFRGNTKRLLDIPMTSVSNASPLRVAIQIPQPDLVLLFLQYGSAIKFDQGDGSSSSPLEPLLKQISESYCLPKASLGCLKILLRAFPTIGYLPTQAPDPQDYECDGLIRLEERLISDDLVPLSRCGGTPPELKHLCRCLIRHSLWLKWQLPYGIFMLPLPNYLKEYLNLEHD